MTLYMLMLYVINLAFEYIDKKILISLNSTFMLHMDTCINRIQWYIVPNFDSWAALTIFGLYLYFLSLKFDLKQHSRNELRPNRRIYIYEEDLFIIALCFVKIFENWKYNSWMFHRCSVQTIIKFIIPLYVINDESRKKKKIYVYNVSPTKVMAWKWRCQHPPILTFQPV